METYGTEHGSGTADDITNDLKIDFECSWSRSRPAEGGISGDRCVLTVRMGALPEEDCKYLEWGMLWGLCQHQPILSVSSHGPQSGGTRRACWFPRGVVRHFRGHCEDVSVPSICPGAHPIPRSFSRGSTTLLNRDAHVGEYTRETLLHERT